MAYFPFFMELSDQPGLIVGGGTVALRKVEKLLPYGPRLTVVAPQFIPGLSTFQSLRLVERNFCPADLDGAAFVIAATDNVELNREISRLCREHRVPVNVVDDKEACTFLFPALVQQGPLSVGISTGGASPTAAVWLKERVNALLPERLDDILIWLEEQRPSIKLLYPEEHQRAALFARLFSVCMAADGPLNDAQLRAVLEQEDRL